MFSLKQMTIRKTTVDNSVKYNHSANSSLTEISQDHKLKNASLTRTPNKKHSPILLRNQKKTGENFKTIKWWKMNCYL